MDYNKLIELLKVGELKKVIVTGPQRSGTRFTTNVLAHDLDVELIDELDYGINDINNLLATIEGKDGFIVQGPAVSHLLHKLPDDVFVVFMQRPINEILASQARINWKSKEHEPTYKGFYKKEFGTLDIDWSKPLADVKYQLWNNHQKPNTKKNYYDLDYNTLSEHAMWQDKLDRKTFKANQIK